VSFVEDEEEEEEEGDENEDNEEEEEEEESSEESDEDTEADSDEQQDEGEGHPRDPAPRSEDNLISAPDNTTPTDHPPLPSASTTTNTTAATATTTKSKRGSRKNRTPSPSPPPPPPPPPPPSTIRLDIPLGGPDNYEVNISSLAKATGQRPATPEPIAIKPETTESGADDEKDRAVAQGVVKRKKAGPFLTLYTLYSCAAVQQRKSAASEYYDTTDPFIDDSELGLDQRTYFAQTKQQGFYVSSGEVVLLKEK
jgi:hypothetical protein